MINKNLFQILSNELSSGRDSENLEIIERLNLASIILNDDFLSFQIIKDYLECKNNSGDSQNALIELFAKFLYSKKSNGEEAGIYPFLRKFVSIINQITKTEEYSHVKSPTQKAQIMDAEIDIIQKKLVEYNSQMIELSEKAEKLKHDHEILLEKEAEYSFQLSEYEKLKEQFDKIQARIEKFNAATAEVSIEELNKQTLVLEEKYESIKKMFKDNQNFEQYYNLLANIVRDYDLLNQISQYRQIAAEISEDVEIGHTIGENVGEINVAALKSVLLKIEPFFEELKNELKSIVAQLEHI